MGKATLEDIKNLHLIHYQQIDLLEDPYQALVYYEKGDEVIELYNDKKLVFKKKISSVTDGFKKIDFKVMDESTTPYAIIQQQKGVHGEQVMIISLADGKELFHQTSAWPMEIIIDHKGVDVKVVDEKKKTSQKRWRP